MNTCKDCIHYYACSAKGGLYNEKDINKEMLCGNFKDKSEIIELPCKFGDVLYHHDEIFGILEYSLQSVCGSVLGIEFEAYAYDADGAELLDAIDFDYEEIGKTVFLTREEAEAALKQKEARNGG